MRIKVRLGRADDARRTLALLGTRLAAPGLARPARAGRAHVAPTNLGEYLYGPPAWDGNSRILLPVFPVSGLATVRPPPTTQSIFRIWGAALRRHPSQ